MVEFAYATPLPNGRLLKKGYPCDYDIPYHFVFALQYRRALLDEAIVAERVRLTHEIQER